MSLIDLSAAVWPEADQGRQPSRPVAPSRRWVDKGLEFLTHANADTAWTLRGGMISMNSISKYRSTSGVAEIGYSLTNAQTQSLLSRGTYLTKFAVALVVAVPDSAGYPKVFAEQSVYNGGSTGGGWEVGIGGNLGTGPATGGIYSVVRSATYPGNQTLLASSVSVTAGQVITIAARISPTSHVLNTFGLGDNSSSTIAPPGPNTTLGAIIGETQSAGSVATLIAARFASYLSDGDLASLKANPWQLFEPDSIPYLVSVSALYPTLSNIRFAPATPTGGTFAVDLS